MLLIPLKNSLKMASPQSCGGKAYQLIELARRGYLVPAFCILETETIAERLNNTLERNSVLKWLPGDPEEIQGWMEQQRQFGFRNFIVRSSMCGEDSKEMSFAGQLESFSNLTQIQDVIEAIEKCVLSSQSLRLKSYLNAKGIESNSWKPQVAVILQVMIEADVAGVLFSADPRDGNRRRFLISSNYGACEAVVGGLYDCDEFSVDPIDNTYTSKIVAKESELKFAEIGLASQKVETSKIHKSSLNFEQISRLVKIGKELTCWQDSYVDVEWVIKGDKIWIVQMRPVTGLGPDRSEQKEYVFDNSNIQESFNGLTLPLTFSYAKQIYFHVYRQIMQVMGFSQEVIASQDVRHQQMLGLIQGRVYYNINSWYAGLLFLPNFGRNKKDMEQMMGLETPVDFILDLKLSKMQKLQRLPEMIRLMTKLSWEFFRIDSRVKKFRLDFQKTVAKVRIENLRWLSAYQLFELHEKTKNKILNNWYAPILNDFYVMMLSGRVRRSLEKIGCVNLLPDLLVGIELESIRPTESLIDIVEELRLVPEQQAKTLTHLLCNVDEKFWRELENFPKSQSKVETFISLYGDRVAGELKLETLSLRQDRSFMLRILKSYFFDANVTLKNFKIRQKELREKAEVEVFTSLQNQRGRLSLLLFKAQLKNFRRAVAYREAMRLDRTRSFGLFRSLNLAIGERLFEMGELQNARDIFYLKCDEIDDFLHRKAVFENLLELVETRKKQYQSWSELKPSPQIKSFGNKIQKQAQTALSSELVLKGQACFPGIVEARVVVLTSPNENIDLKGKILVTERTDPGWTPLFLQLSGLLVERGSLLSHSAVVARELGIPTIVGLKNICQLLKTDDLVHFDASTGEVRLLQSKDQAYQKSEIRHKQELEV